ncbi:MAG TPA: type I-U CRISPR-associated RAMP protein Csb1/Cas7u [Bryobacteraceae bacterium]|nr:type I-U CRISPR-associated RAMP protein Csb1/Cas7u [Bryobacteraceae bacterium]
MDSLLTSFDSWLAGNGPAALVVREHLMPVEGSDGVLFPATFAAGDGFEGGYNIDRFPDGRSVCLIDSVGSQANRIEPLFAQDGYADLTPQIVIKAGEKRVNLLEAGHRAGDAIVRCTALRDDLRAAFKAVQTGDAEPLAKLAPTSIVFGVWDSRDTQAKLPRLIVSTIRAFNVRALTRSAQYVPAAEYVADGLLPEPADKTTKDAYAVRGFIHVPAAGSHGGVIADGGIQRDAALHLAGLRLLNGGANAQALRRYILGLALTAFTYPAGGYLRQGCHLVMNPDKAREFQAVYGDGRREDATVTHDAAVAYARAAAKGFGPGHGREVEFDKELAQKDVSGDAGGSAEKRKGKPAKK